MLSPLMRRRPTVLWLSACLSACAAPSVLPPPVDLVGEARPIPELRAEPPCDGQQLTMITQGTLYTPDGVPVPFAPIRIGSPGGPRAFQRADAKGNFELTLDKPDVITPADARSTPPSLCVALPSNMKIVPPNNNPIRMFMRNNNFLVPPHCGFKLEIDDSVTWPATLWMHNGEQVFGLDTFAEPPTEPVFLPCDTRGVMLTSEHGYAGGDGCALAPGFACAGEDRVVQLRAHPATTWSITLVDGQNKPIAGAQVHTAWGDHVTHGDGVMTLQVPTLDAPVDIAAKGFVPRHLPRMPSGPVTMQAARSVEVRCAGAPADRCPLVPWSRPAAAADDEATPCELVPSVGAVCAVPADADAVVLAAGVRTLLPAGRAVGWVDLRGVTGGARGQVKAAVDAGCAWQATRSIGLLDDAFAARSPDAPRTRILSGRCGARGALEVAPLSPGSWALDVYVPGGGRVRRDVSVSAAIVELGEL